MSFRKHVWKHFQKEWIKKHNCNNKKTFIKKQNNVHSSDIKEHTKQSSTFQKK